MYFVYVLLSLKDRKLYKGSTSNLVRRIRQHNNGTTESTRRRRPFVLIYCEEYLTKKEAESREMFLKSGKGREELKKMLGGAILPPACGKILRPSENGPKDKGVVMIPAG